MKSKIHSIEEVRKSFEQQGYICNDSIATSVFLSAQLHKPILVEGPPGVGKTELAKASAAFLEAPLIRMQCYEGLDEAKALYEWKYGKQLLYTQLLKEKLGDVLGDAQSMEESMERLRGFGDLFYSEDFLEPRPLLQALRASESPVLLIDEIDKADQEFESFLLELLSDFQISIPEFGTVRAQVQPLVFLTSNNTRELTDALKRRCLHLYIPFPDQKLEQQIISARVPEAAEQLRRQLVAFVQEIREMDLRKAPAISETIDWARSLVLMHADQIDRKTVSETLNVLLKHEEDIQTVKDDFGRILGKTQK